MDSVCLLNLQFLSRVEPILVLIMGGLLPPGLYALNSVALVSDLERLRALRPHFVMLTNRMLLSRVTLFLVL
jgi:hypothetical protein